MFLNLILRKLNISQVRFPTACNLQTIRGFKVCVVGASGGIGQPLSLLLKQNPLIETLTVYDVAHSLGVGADLSHIDTHVRIRSFLGDEKIKDAMDGADVVVVPAGRPRKPGMTRQDLLTQNADITATVACAVSESCPQALLAIITNPVNSTIPIVAEFLKSRNVFDPNRLFGVTTLDVVRAKTFTAEFMGIANPMQVDIPVIGGHAGITILPIFSHCSPCFKGEAADVSRLTKRIQDAGTEVVNAKAGQGSATLSMAYAGARFVNSLLRGLCGESVVEYSYVASNVTELPYFSNALVLGKNGIEKNLGLPELNSAEKKAMEMLLPALRENIDEAIAYTRNAGIGSMKKEKECV